METPIKEEKEEIKQDRSIVSKSQNKSQTEVKNKTQNKSSIQVQDQDEISSQKLEISPKSDKKQKIE